MKKVFLGILIFSFSSLTFAQPILFEGCDEHGYVRCTPDDPIVKVVKVKAAKRATPRLDALEKLSEDALQRDLKAEKRAEGIEIFLTAEQESRQISDENLEDLEERVEKLENQKRNVVVYNKIYQQQHHRPAIKLEIGAAGGLTPSVGCYVDKVSIFEEVGINLSLIFPLGNTRWLGKTTGYIGLSPTIGLGWGGFFSTLRQIGFFRVGPVIGGLIDSGVLAGTRVWNAGGGVEMSFVVKSRIDVGIIGIVGVNGFAVNANKGDYGLGWAVIPYINVVLF